MKKKKITPPGSLSAMYSVHERPTQLTDSPMPLRGHYTLHSD